MLSVSQQRATCKHTTVWRSWELIPMSFHYTVSWKCPLPHAHTQRAHSWTRWAARTVCRGRLMAPPGLFHSAAHHQPAPPTLSSGRHIPQGSPGSSGPCCGKLYFTLFQRCTGVSEGVVLGSSCSGNMEQSNGSSLQLTCGSGHL